MADIPSTPAGSECGNETSAAPARELVEELFCDALELEFPEERDAYLKKACAGNGRLRAAVDAMLARQPDAEKFFRETSPLLAQAGDISRAVAEYQGICGNESWPSPVEEVGRRIGPYALLERIGEGGCGSVYRAGQESPVRREVALKIIKLGMDTKRVIARFEAERQALAMMDHPNIARVFDAGATDAGRPFFVMELVRGVKITEYCDSHHLGPPQRLRLFLQVCGAIQHAHQKGIIHRDIKPSNVLVTMHDGEPVPKVIDFGIAKATGGPPLTDKTVFTSHEHFVGTPAYMSPEQAACSGLDVDTRSDVYSLGVLLYELLTGGTPFDRKELLQSSLEEMRRTLCEYDPPPPSSRVRTMPAGELARIAQLHHVEPRRLMSLLNGDLDWIVMKALEKDRARRYQTVNGLAADLRRYLSNEPVLARPPSRLYRFRKLVRRNRATFAAIGAVSVTLMGGLGLSSWLFIREREARQEQVRLREEAERARNAEVLLRDEAEARAKIARAAYLLSRGRVAEADQLVDNIQIPIQEPSLEAAGLFRRLADWNASQSRWEQAASRYLNLVHANQVDKSDLTDEATRDLLSAGPTLIYAGNRADYRRLVRETAMRFARTPNPVAAEHVLKFSLVIPVDPETLELLKPLALVVKKSFENEDSQWAKDIYMVSWRAYALALYEYRRGEFGEAAAWARRSLESPDQTATRIAMSHLVLAMALDRQDRVDEARSELAAAEGMVKERFPGGMVDFRETARAAGGFWHDWLITQILLEEAGQKAQPER